MTITLEPLPWTPPSNPGVVEQALREARALVEKGWCKGTSSEWETRRKFLLFKESYEARFCAGHALGLATDHLGRRDIDAVFRTFRDVIGIHDIPAWNDMGVRTQAEVLAAFDTAIAQVSA